MDCKQKKLKTIAPGDYSAYLSNQELFIIARQSGNHLARYWIATRIAEMFPIGPGQSDEPTVQYNVPDSLVEQKQVSPETSGEYLRIFEDIYAGIPSGFGDVEFRTEDGEYRWHHCKYSLIYNEKREPLYALFSFFDNTKQREMQEAREKWKAGLAALISESIMYIEVNLSQNRIDLQEGKGFYLRSGENSKIFSKFVARGADFFALPEVKPEYEEFFDRKRLINLFSGGVNEDLFEYRLKSDEDTSDYKWVRASVRMTRHPGSDDVFAFIAYSDVDNQRRRMDELAILASHDPLTGLFNRSALTREIELRLSQFRRESFGALFVVDLDNFKLVNDNFGHMTGDEVLRQTAETLQRAVGRDSVVGRLGGDEFMVFFFRENILQIEETAKESVNALQFCAGNGKHFDVSASIGVAVTAENCGFDALYEQADGALYAAKKNGKCGYSIVRADRGKLAPSLGATAELGSVQLQFLLEYIGGGVILFRFETDVSKDFEIVYISPSYFKNMGFTTEMTGFNNEKLLSFIFKDDLPVVMEKLRQTAADGTVNELLYRAQMPFSANLSLRHAFLTNMPGGKDGHRLVVCTVSDLSNLSELKFPGKK